MKRRHTREELRALLGMVEAGRHPIRARRTGAIEFDERFVVWSAARAEANLAYDDWCSAPGADQYLVYRAAEDRADAAEAALARSSTIAT